MTDRRRFTPSERIALFIASGGLCAQCGSALESGWHADHVRPWSKGGNTDVLNGQALCPSCNLEKGNRVTDLRPWQRLAIDKFNESPRADFLVSATPGAGKTRFALEIAKQLLNSQRVGRVVVVVPTTHLRSQWCDAAYQLGINLDPEYENRQAAGETKDFDGYCATYAQVSRSPQLHRTLCRLSTLVIFDEIHHAGTQRSWGDGIREAFDHSGVALRLALTGTPFREDGFPIPFITYGPDGRCIIDVPYGYGDALRDGAVRNIIFPTFEGEMEWWSSEYGVMTASFADEIPSEEESHRLRTALDPQGEWIRDVVVHADRKLLEVRKSAFAAAAGLIVAIDHAHARNIARILKQLTGSDAVVALSDDADASRKISDFAKGDVNSPRWLIAVRMVSEGVDIPRLFVGVWATNVLTNLFFRQVVGRFVRLIPDLEDQTGFLFLPHIEHLVEYVATIKSERDAVVKSFETESDQEDTSDPRTTPRLLSDWTPYNSLAIEDATFIGDERFTAQEMAEIRQFLVGSGLEGASPHTAALIIRRYLSWTKATAPNAQPQATQRMVDTPIHQQRDQLRRRVRYLVNILAQIYADQAVPVDQKGVFTALMAEQGVRQEDATIEQLKERIQLVTRWTEEARHASR